ncbi:MULTISPECIES: DUF4105 domain-containing protein [Hydrocarboniphaga]|uniref:Uncharacterized protein n=1 Tax=Hydrocarboniphaga effusa AP103 TaxID=1172194 RepID=I8HZN5_9GAMM|nr:MULTISPECIES: DUF4105 domain-containing protein [Hydrocarboniphaga]EIT69076.1 hypothetical protein WQQ_26580 [Hydrocarboniphaga effusa AP103]MDZ4078344.1 DUF4105 domain-containing protein [Hydrocarboniphaga sp.]
MRAHRLVKASLSGLLLTVLCLPVQAQQPVAQPPTVSVLTFAPGEIYWQRFGHNALLLRDEASGRATVYNYGIFDFQQKNFFLNFARGQMLYQLDAEPLRRTLQLYRAEDRWIYEQRLALDEAQRREIAEFLQWNAQPENAQYRYDYFLSNCSTRVRDAIDRVLGGSLKAQLHGGQLSPATFRSEVTRLMSPDLPLAIGMDLGLGPKVDEPLDRWSHAFVPMSLMQSLREAKVADPETGLSKPLVEQEGWLYESDRIKEPEQAPNLLWPFLALGVISALAVLLLARARAKPVARITLALAGLMFYATASVFGLVMLAGWLLTDHWGMWSNQNLLLLNPLALLAIPVWAQAFRADWRPGPKAQRVVRIIALLAATASLIKLLPTAPMQNNAAWIALLLPVHAALFWVVLQLGRGLKAVAK